MALPQIDVLVNGFGTAYAAGTATAYLAGTTTLATWYEDAAATTPAANPYTLDANGKAVLYCAQRIKLDVKNSTGTSAPGFPIDNIGYGLIFQEYSAANYDTLAEAQADIGSTVATLRIPAGSYTVAADLTFPATCAVIMDNGAVITVNSGKVLTFNGSFAASMAQCFVATGTVKFGPGSISHIETPWFGTSSSLADNATYLQAAFSSAVADAAAYHPVHLPAGSYTTSTVYVPEGVIFYGDGAIESASKAATKLVQKTGTNTDTLRMIPHESGGAYFWFGTIRDMSLFGDGSGTAGSGISFVDASNNGVYPQDTTVLRNLIIRKYPSHGINLPVGALPFTCSDIKLLFNGGHGIYLKGSANAVQAVHFNNISGDGNLGGDSSGGALIYVESVDSRGHITFTNLKSEQRTNTDRGSTVGNTHVLIFKNSAPQVVINGITHISSTGVKPGDVININTTSVPTINWKGVAVRLLPGDTGSDPNLINDQVNTKTVPYTVPSGIYGTAPVTGVFSVASSNVFDTYGAITSYKARSIENPGRQVGGATPAFSLYETDADADEKQWVWVSSGGTTSVRAVSDDGNTNVVAMLINRNGTAITRYQLAIAGIPTSASGLSSGDLYRLDAGGGVWHLCIVP